MGTVAVESDDEKDIDIHTACWYGKIDVVNRLLYEKETRALFKDETEFGSGNTPLHYASYMGHLLICKKLLENGANINALNTSGCTSLFFAAQQGHDKVVCHFLSIGADMRYREKQYGMNAIDVNTSDSVKKVFLQAGGSGE